METSDHDYLRFTSDWQYDSPFSQLPRELRDQIYELALGDIILIQYDLLEFRLKPTFYQTEKDVCAEYINHFPPRGLPVWIRSCKHICVEALESLGRTRTFEPILRSFSPIILPIWSKQDPIEDTPIIRKWNPILFKPHILQNILLNPECSVLDGRVYRAPQSYAAGQDKLVRFLDLLQTFDSQNLTLYTTWSRDWHQMGTRNDRRCRAASFKYPDLLRGEPEAFFSEWDGVWNGRFRCVQITLQFFAPPTVHDASLGILRAAEGFAERLVGRGVVLALEYLGMMEIGVGEGLWRSRVIANRMVKE